VVLLISIAREESLIVLVIYQVFRIEYSGLKLPSLSDVLKLT
jgi:hypothetical protein